MTRRPRLEYAGARYHVINRGNYRKNVFGDEGAAEAFERTLGEAAEKFGWRVVETTQVTTYRWSSLRHYVGKKTPRWLDGEWLLRASGLSSGAAGWRAYCVRLAVLMDDKRCREQLSSKNLSRGWCIGSKKFKQTMQESVKEQLSRWRQRRFTGLEPDERRAEQSRYWEEALQAYAQAAKVNLNGLGKKKSEPDKVKLAAAMKSATSASNGWLAERLGMGEPASVSQFVRRWLADTPRKREFDLLLSRVKV